MKRLLLTFCLSGVFCGAPASASTWEYTITDMVPYSTIPWIEPRAEDANADGRFSGEDLDHDGVLRLDEVVGFTLNGAQVLPWVFWPDPSCGCEEGSHSELSRFSYSPAMGLDFGAATGFGWHDSLGGSIGHGVSWGYFAGSLGGRWGPDTQVSVTLVPEPSVAWLWLAGLGLLGAFVWRRR
ncbi:PEP-CTERM sorting domain-containing protein [Ideonella sp. BN130291]|uniref:PEP-CTERM sorting domain-containing protein n=1 Tax=Ideonella sp. BN130291 TaxID=3112940 RepID=UPI002E271C8F|nr:PEP-CTERM sorting domain-containing protein [Ideonella sp. BN130291]